MSTSKPAGPGRKRLALFFDGTWNEPEDSTNVWRLRMAIAPHSADGIEQKAYYDRGVGTLNDRLKGGAFGQGLSKNVINAYLWLIENYEQGDEIYLFGFSRGAFTARSLAGFIGRCGLLKRNAWLSVKQLYDRYRRADAETWIYALKYFGAKPQSFEEETMLTDTYYSRNLIKMVGVWDTVGSLGVPIGRIEGISSSTLRFHSMDLSRTVEQSYQALALDEYRSPYKAHIWHNFLPGGVHPEQPTNDNRYIEQRWFAGAHANVGGGYENDLLPYRPLIWIQQKAIACGLKFGGSIKIYSDDLKMPLRDSYWEFLGGTWKLLTLGHRHVRPLMAASIKKEPTVINGRETSGGTIYPANERIDLSVFERCAMNGKYCPKGFDDWPSRKKPSLKEIVAHPENFQHLWQPITGPGIETPPGLTLAT